MVYPIVSKDELDHIRNAFSVNTNFWKNSKILIKPGLKKSKITFTANPEQGITENHNTD